jgi:26S proteasome regulatory subunit N1
MTNKTTNNNKAVEVAATSKDSVNKSKDSQQQPELSEEDQRIKSEVELLVTRSGDSEEGLAQIAINKICDLLQTARGSAASVPKPLKYIRPHFDTLLTNAKKSKAGSENSKKLYDILSFVSMTRQPTEEREAEEAREREREKEKEKNKIKDDAEKAKEKSKKEAEQKNKNEDAAVGSAEEQQKNKKKDLPFIPMFECIDYKIQGHPTDLASWGYEYVRHLGGDIVKKMKRQSSESENADDTPFALLSKNNSLISATQTVVRYLIEHQDEPTAVDIAMELGALQFVAPLVDENNCDRVGPYLTALAAYLSSEKDEIFESVFNMYLRNKRYAPALRVAFMLINARGTGSGDSSKNDELIQKVFEAVVEREGPADAGGENGTRSKMIQLQLAAMCGRFRCSTFVDPNGDSDVDALITNERQSVYFRKVAEALDNKAPKAPAEIFKEHVMDKHLVPQVANSHMHNLATSFVSGFVNAGYGADTLVGGAAGDSWIFQTKEHRQMSAVGCVGLLHLWDHEEGFNDIMRFNANPDNNIRAGVLLGTGIISAGIRVPFDPAFAVLSESVAEGARELRVAAIVGMGIAYSGTNRDDVKDLLIPLVVDGSQSVEIQCLAALSLGQVFCGSANDDVSEAVLMCLMDKNEEQLKDPTIRYLILALGLLVLRCGDRAEGLVEATMTLSATIAKYAEVVVLSCAHAATGNVLMVQRLFAIVAEKAKEEEEEDSSASAPAAAAASGEDDANAQQNKKEKKEKKPAPLWSHKAAALMGVALVSIGEEVGSNLVKRAVHHVLLSKEDPASSGRRGLPLALALLSVSDPSITIIDTLSKLSHDSDVPTAQGAILGMGLASAGSNNARVATLLRNLSGYYHKDMNMLYIVRLAQGLTHLGKGHITCSPLKFDRTIVSTVCLSGILSFVHTIMDCEKTVLGDYHFMAFSLVPAFSPRFTMLVNDQIEPVQGQQVRIGAPVDTVAVAGKPKTITGFQTQLSPVLLQEGDRIEIVPGKNQVAAIGTMLEGLVFVEPRKLEDDTAEEGEGANAKKNNNNKPSATAVTSD